MDLEILDLILLKVHSDITTTSTINIYLFEDSNFRDCNISTRNMWIYTYKRIHM